MFVKFAVAALSVLGVAQGNTVCGSDQLYKAKDIKSYPVFPHDTDCLIPQVLSKEVWEEYQGVKDAHGHTIQEQIFSGCKNTDSKVGVYASSPDSYTAFNKLYDPLIEKYHTRIHHAKPQERDMNFQKLTFNLRPDEKKMILSTRVRVARNLDGYPFGTTINRQQRLEVEKKVIMALKSLDGDLAGTYYSLRTMSMRDRQQLVKDHFLFKEGDKYLEAAGLNRDWPEGRGIFHNKDKTFLVWINEEDQLRIISMQEGTDVVTTFTRLARAMEHLEKSLTFAWDDQYGYLTSCPTNIGTGMRASVHIKLPHLGVEEKQMKSLASSFNLQIRGVDGEHSNSPDHIYDISNKQRLGRTEMWLAQNLFNGIKAIIQAETRMKIMREHASDL